MSELTVQQMKNASFAKFLSTHPDYRDLKNPGRVIGLELAGGSDDEKEYADMCEAEHKDGVAVLNEYHLFYGSRTIAGTQQEPDKCDNYFFESAGHLATNECIRPVRFIKKDE